jgi:hypothetical protein
MVPPVLTLLLLLTANAQPSETPTAAQTAEARRLHDELSKLASKGAWDGVERKFVELMALGVPLDPADVVLGAQSSMQSGDVQTALDRLEHAADDPAAVALREQLLATYVRVTLRTEPVVETSLDMAQLPLAPDQRAVVKRAMAQVAETGAYDGWLPAGGYEFAGAQITVERGADPIELVRDMSWGGKNVR